MTTIIEFAKTQAADRGIKAIMNAPGLTGKVTRKGTRLFETTDCNQEQHCELMDRILDVVMSVGCWKDDVFFI